jgi:radical SAM family uncharacterized protein
MTSDVDIAPLLDRVSKPAQYLGSELNARNKPWNTSSTKFALCFPDAYEIGMSNLAMGVLYERVNDHSPHLCDRAFTPFPDMADLMRAEGLPLFGWETRRPLAEFDIVGFSLSYESGNTNVLEMLDLADIPLESNERAASHPLVLGGGSAVMNPEPMADFFDLVAIGEGEQLLPDLLDAYARFDRDLPGWRSEFLVYCAETIPGIYVPTLYSPRFRGDRFEGYDRLHPKAPEQIERQFVDLDAFAAPSLPVVPSTEVVHDRVAIELDRGCARACRFCQAGYIYRPVRRRSAEGVSGAVDQCLAATGQSDVSLLSLNAVDYDGLDELIADVQDGSPDYLRVGIPSTRVESFNVDIARALRRGGNRGGSLTFAPEAATPRMRRVINKEISDEDLLHTCDMAFAEGFRTIKLYFMIGQPTETLDDARAIAHLANRVMALGRQHHGAKAKINVTVSTFIPKPFTPFQWHPQDHPEAIRAKQKACFDIVRDRNVHLMWHDTEESQVEAVLALGDRRVGRAIRLAWERGSRFDGWLEHFKSDIWLEAISEAGIDLDELIYRERDPGDPLPWDHISIQVSKRLLQREYARALQAADSAEPSLEPALPT